MAGIKGKSRKIPIEDVEKLAQIGATQREMAAFFRVDIATMERRLAQPKYRTILQAGDANMRISLRRKQLELALKGDRTMLVWLGKQMLGQVDKHEIEQTGEISHVHELRAVILQAAAVLPPEARQAFASKLIELDGGRDRTGTGD